MNITKNSIIGELVAQDYNMAGVFSQYKIDFCCQGNRSIEKACRNTEINIDLLLADLEKINTKGSGENIDFQSWSLDLLCDYIEKKHHRYVNAKVPIIHQYLQKLCQVHGGRHPELFELEKLFGEAAGALTMHMKKEELVLFPFIKKMVNAQFFNQEIDAPHFGTVENPIAMMMEEHDTEGERFRAIAKISNNYTPPTDGCTTYRVCFAMLQEFEADLHKHIHLENNILFPQAVQMEANINKLTPH